MEQIAVYSQIDAIDSDSETLRALSRGEVGYIMLTSSNIARAFLNALDDTVKSRIKRGEVQLCSISPVTSATIRELGFLVAIEAKQYTVEGLIAALVQHLQSKKPIS